MKGPFSLLPKNEDTTLTVSSTSKYGWLHSIHLMFLHDFIPPLRCAHHLVGCLFIDWLNPLLQISVGRERRRLHATVFIIQLQTWKL